MNKLVSCIARNYGQGLELVRIVDVVRDGVKPVEGERVVTGRMTSCDINVGPSGSHRVTVWTRGRLVLETLFGEEHAQTPEQRFIEIENQIAKSQQTPLSQLLGSGASDVSCVLRSFDGRRELVRVEEAVGLQVGEPVMSGLMAPSSINVGPSRSHSVRVWTQRSDLVESRYGIVEEPAVLVNIEESVEIERAPAFMMVPPQIDAELSGSNIAA